MYFVYPHCNLLGPHKKNKKYQTLMILLVNKLSPRSPEARQPQQKELTSYNN